MKYMLLLLGTQAEFDWFARWPPQDFKAQAAFMQAFHQDHVLGQRVPGSLVP